MSRPRIQITLIDQKGTKGCHRGHKIGDSYDFDTERGNLCPMAMHVAFPYVDILRYGGEIPGNPKGTAIFACPDVDTLNVFNSNGLMKISGSGGFRSGYLLPLPHSSAQRAYPAKSPRDAPHQCATRCSRST